MVTGLACGFGILAVILGLLLWKLIRQIRELERQIRFLEESRVLQAHGSRGDFEIYPYGLEIDRFRNGEPETLAAGDFASLTQSA